MKQFIVNMEPFGDFYASGETGKEAKTKAWESLTDDQRDQVAAIQCFEVPEQEVELWNADPSCIHNIKSASGGGIRCIRCRGWFCY